MQILVIEDDPDLLAVMQIILLRGGFEVRTAPDGDAALRLLRQARADLVLLDLKLEQASGWDVWTDIRGESDVPVIPVTASVAPADIERARERGAEDYITKPFSPRDLLRRVREVLAQGSAAGPASAPDPSRQAPIGALRR